MSIKIDYTPTTVNLNCKHTSYLPGGGKIIGVQVDPFQEAA